MDLRVTTNPELAVAVTLAVPLATKPGAAPNVMIWLVFLGAE